MLNHRVGGRVSGAKRTSSSATASYSISVPVFGMTTPVLSVGEERGGFTGIFEIVAADKARVGRVKGDPFASPTSPLAPLLPQSTSPPCWPKGRTGQRAMVNHAFVTDQREPHSACCPLRRNLAGRVLPLTCYDATAWTKYWRAISRRRRPGFVHGPSHPSLPAQHHGGAPGA